MITVIKIGGKVLESEQRLEAVLSAMSRIEGRNILVHGGGSSATRLAEKMKVPVRMTDGRRITDEVMLDIVTMVYGGLMNKRVVAGLQAQGINAVGLTGADLDVIRAHKRPAGLVDYGWVGDIDQVNPDALIQLLDQQVVPVLAPLTHDGLGHMLNTNADNIAAAVAVALADIEPVSLVYCFELPGVMWDPGDPSSLIRDIDVGTYEQLRANGTISGGMIPKLTNAFDALAQGVKHVIICQESALSSLETPTFIGTILTH